MSEMVSKNITWKYLLSRRWTILRDELFTKGYAGPLEKYIGAPGRNLLVVKEGEKHTLYHGLESLRGISEALVEKLKKNKDFDQKIYKDCIEACENLVNVSKDVSRGDLNSLEPEELIKRLERFIGACDQFAPFLALPNNYEIYVTNKIKHFLLEKAGQKRVEEYLQKLMSPKEYPFQILEQIDLAKIALRVKKGEKTNLDKDLDDHLQKYQWLSCYNFDEDEFSLDDFRERLDVVLDLPLKELESKTEDIVKKLERDDLEFKATVKETGLSGELLKQVNLLREFVFLRTYRIEMNSQSNFYLRPLLKGIASRGAISLEQLAMMLSNEIKEMIKSGKVPELVNFDDRKKAAVTWLDNCSFGYAFGSKAQQIISEKLAGQEMPEQAGEVKGTVASKGDIVQGKVRIIMKENVTSFQKDEILVTVMTSPEFVPAIQKAKAIITDEGGVLCHAAIVSRELNKPCVIGTEIATKVLKTGDLVEVDAEQGIVRKLEKAK